MTADLRAALDTMESAARFLYEQIARYRALAAEAPKDDRERALLAPFAAMGGDWAMPAYHDLEADIIVWGPSAGRYVTAGDVRAARRYLDGGAADEPDYRPALAAPPVPAGVDAERLAALVSDSLAATTEGTAYAEAPDPSDEPGSPYVMRLTNELLSRGVSTGDERLREAARAMLLWTGEPYDVEPCQVCGAYAEEGHAECEAAALRAALGEVKG